MLNSDREEEDTPHKANVCLYLGLEEDRQTCTAYPSEWNVCHHARPVAVVNIEHQRMVCLSPRYEECPVFQAKEAQALPAQLLGHRKTKKNRSHRTIIPMHKRA